MEFNVGDRVKLTGETWRHFDLKMFGTTQTITRFDDYAHGPVFMYGGHEFMISEPDWEAELVTPTALTAPVPVEHPNFIQVQVEDGDWTETYCAYRTEHTGRYDTRPYYGVWMIPEQSIMEPTEVWGLRALLDEIERRMIAEEEDS